MAQVMAHARTFIGDTESREMRINRIQANRLRLIGVLTFMEVVYLSVICMSYYTDAIAFVLILLCTVCFMLNMPIIWWVYSLWWEQYKREREIRKQANERR